MFESLFPLTSDLFFLLSKITCNLTQFCFLLIPRCFWDIDTFIQYLLQLRLLLFSPERHFENEASATAPFLVSAPGKPKLLNGFLSQSPLLMPQPRLTHIHPVTSTFLLLPGDSRLMGLLRCLILLHLIWCWLSFLPVLSLTIPPKVCPSPLDFIRCLFLLHFPTEGC